MSIFNKLRRNPIPREKLTNKPGLIGLDIGNQSLHLCQLRPEPNNRYTIIAKSSIGYSGSRQQLLQSPKEFKRLLVKATKGKSFKGSKVTAVMPPDEVRIILLTYKANVTDVDAEVIRMLKQRVEGNIDDYVIDYLPVRINPSDEEHIIMASVAKREKVEKFLDLLTSAGLQVHSLDIGPSTLRRLISVLYTDDKSSNVLLINTGEDQSYLTIVSGRRLLFDQPVKFGCNPLLQEIAQTLEIPVEQASELVLNHGFAPSPGAKTGVGMVSQADISRTLLEIIKPAFIDLVEEINRVLIFTASETRGNPLSRVYLLGCIARMPDAHNLLLSLLDIDVPLFPTDFYDKFLDDSDLTEPWLNQLPEMAIATGLALRGLTPDE